MLTDHVLPYKKKSHFETSKTPTFLIPLTIKYTLRNKPYKGMYVYLFF